MNASYHLKSDSHCLVIAHPKWLSERGGWIHRHKPNKVECLVPSYIYNTITERITCLKFWSILRNPRNVVSPKSSVVIVRFPRGCGTCIVWFSVEPTTLDHSNIFFEKASNLISFERSYALIYLPSRMPHFEKIFELKLSHKWKVRYHVRVIFLP